MKTTMSLVCLIIVFVGFALVGDAIGQPNDPTPAASDTSGGDSSSESGDKTEAKPDESKPAEDKSEPSEAKTEKEETKETPTGIAEQGKALYSASKNGDWMIAIALLMMLIGTAARWLVGKKWAFLKSKAGGYSIAIAMGLGILGTGMYEVGFSLGLLMNAVLVTTSSMGLYGAAKDSKESLKPAGA